MAHCRFLNPIWWSMSAFVWDFRPFIFNINMGSVQAYHLAVSLLCSSLFTDVWIKHSFGVSFWGSLTLTLCFANVALVSGFVVYPFHPVSTSFPAYEPYNSLFLFISQFQVRIHFTFPPVKDAFCLTFRLIELICTVFFTLSEKHCTCSQMELPFLLSSIHFYGSGVLMCWHWPSSSPSLLMCVSGETADCALWHV